MKLFSALHPDSDGSRSAPQQGFCSAGVRVCVKRDWKTTCELWRGWAGSAVITENGFFGFVNPLHHEGFLCLPVQASVMEDQWLWEITNCLLDAAWLLGEHGLAEVAVVASWT